MKPQSHSFTPHCLYDYIFGMAYTRFGWFLTVPILVKMLDYARYEYKQHPTGLN
jgi:hypothetical protein